MSRLLGSVIFSRRCGGNRAGLGNVDRRAGLTDDRRRLWDIWKRQIKRIADARYKRCIGPRAVLARYARQALSRVRFLNELETSIRISEYVCVLRRAIDADVLGVVRVWNDADSFWVAPLHSRLAVYVGQNVAIGAQLQGRIEISAIPRERLATEPVAARRQLPVAELEAAVVGDTDEAVIAASLNLPRDVLH